MNIFPKKEESEIEFIFRVPALGGLIAVSLLFISYFSGDYIGAYAGLIALVGYIFIGIYGYRKITQLKVLRKAMKSGVNVHISGNVYSLTDSVVYTIKKADL